MTGIVHRYPDRVLLKPLHVCPVYCRFCFRREMVGPDGLGTLTDAELDAALAYIAQRSADLGGGADRRRPVRALAAPARRHRRPPRGHRARAGHEAPHPRAGGEARSRLRGAGAGACGGSAGAVFVALHANHPREFTPAARAACARLVEAGIPDGQPVGAAARRQRRCRDPRGADARPSWRTGSSPTTCITGDLAPGTGASAHRPARGPGSDARRCAVGSRGSPSRPTCSTFPAGTARCRSDPGYLRETADGPRVTDPNGREHAYPPKA